MTVPGAPRPMAQDRLTRLARALNLAYPLDAAAAYAGVDLDELAREDDQTIGLGDDRLVFRRGRWEAQRADDPPPPAVPARLPVDVRLKLPWPHVTIGGKRKD